MNAGYYPGITGGLRLAHFFIPVRGTRTKVSRHIIPFLIHPCQNAYNQNYSSQEAKESFASPDYLVYGKLHIVKQLYRDNGCKKPFLFVFDTTTRGNGPKWNPSQIDAQTTLFIPRSHLSGLIQQIGTYLATTKVC